MEIGVLLPRSHKSQWQKKRSGNYCVILKVRTIMNLKRHLHGNDVVLNLHRVGYHGLEAELRKSADYGWAEHMV